MYHEKLSVQGHTSGVAPIQAKASREEDLRSVSPNSVVQPWQASSLSWAEARKGLAATPCQVASRLLPTGCFANYSRNYLHS